MNLKIDIIICTYNRPIEVNYLVQQLLNLNPLPNRIIVVDSTEEDNLQIKNKIEVTYIKSLQKNQPFQRYLGFQNSFADFILYLDDDMEVINNEVIGDIKLLLVDKNVSGIAINFKDKFENNSLSKIPNSYTKKLPLTISNFLRYITFNKKPEVSKLGLFGERGKQPDNINKTELISGGAFVAKRELLFKNFNFQIFELFDKKIGMGEDSIIGYGLCKLGNILYFPKLSFYHNDQGSSNYSINLKAFGKRVIFSRLYIALEKTRLDNKSLLLTRLQYIIYGFSRLLGLTMNHMIKPTHDKKNMLIGSFKGYLLSFKFKFKFENSTNKFENNNY